MIGAAQLVLNLGHRPAFGRDEFLVSASNRDAVTWIDRWPDWPGVVRGLNVHGPAASGKTHLGAVWRARSGAVLIDAPVKHPMQVPDILKDRRDVVLDGLDSTWPGEPVLHICNLVTERGGCVLALTREPLGQLGLAPPDLTSRLAAFAAVPIDPPDDALIIGVMNKLFRDRQLQVGRDVLHYLVSRMERSLGAAARLVDWLDATSLSEGRPVTLPLARRALSADRDFTHD